MATSPAPVIDAASVSELLAAGRALPADFYTDAAIRELEDRLIFRRTWQLAGTVCDLQNPGDYVTLDVARVPVVVVRCEDGSLNAFVNVCVHRANVVMSGSGNCDRLLCGYHGWSYGFDGALKGAPKRREGNLPDGLSLRKVAVDTWGGLVFVCLEPQESLADQLGDMPELMAAAGYDFPFADPGSGLTPLAGDGNFDGVVNSNWKVFIENGSECYHCPLAHRDTLCAVTDTDALEFRIASRGKFGVVVGLPLRPQWQQKFPDGKSGSPYGFAVYTLWPNTMLFSGYIGEHVTRYEPMGTGRVRYIARSYGRPDLPAAPLAEIIDVLFTRGNHEDIALVEQTQRGLESGYYEPGPLMAGPEAVINAFQRTVWDALRPAFVQGG